MPNVTVDNTPVSVVLLGDETFTVPSDEVVKVTIIANAFGSEKVLRINGTGVAETPQDTTQPIDLVLDSGDTVTAESEHSLHISGLVIA